MKKFIKYCFIIGIVCVIGGLIAVKSGTEMGGLSLLIEQVQNGEWNINADPFFELENQGLFDDHAQVHVEGTDLKEQYAVGTFEDLYVKGAGLTFQVNLTDDDTVYIRADKTGKYQSYIKEDTLYVIATGKSKEEIGEGVVEILIPRKKASQDDFDVEFALGAVALTIDELIAEHIDIELDAGAIQWESLETNELEIEMNAGVVKGNNTKVWQDTELHLNAGSMELSGVLGIDTEVDMAAGKIELALEEAFEDYNYELSCAGGTLTVGDVKLEGLAKEKTISNQASKNMAIECSAGTVEISFE